MKRFLNFLILITISLSFTNSYSQKFYINFGVGNNYSAAPDYKMTNNANIITSDNTGTNITGVRKQITNNISFGKGFQYGGTIGYMPSNSLCFELSVNYLKSKEFEDKFKEEYVNYSEVYIQKFTSQTMRFTPSVRFTFKNDILSPYMKTGMVIGVGTKIHVVENFDFRDQNGKEVVQDSEFDLFGGISIGFAAGIGVSLETDKPFGFFSEVNIITQSWAPEKLSYTKFYQNSMDVIGYVPVKDREWVFVDSFSSQVSNTNANLPSERLKDYFPFSSIGWNIGIYFKL